MHSRFTLKDRFHAIGIFTLILIIIPGVVLAAPTINGQLYGDGDIDEYSELATAEGGRGRLLYLKDGSSLKLAVEISPTVNDNVFGDNTLDRDYLDSANWNNHNFKHLLNSDRLTWVLSCDGTTWTWTQDYLYEKDGEWVSGNSGPDSGGNPFPGIEATGSSLAWNLENSTWDITLDGARNGTKTYKSADDDFVSDQDVTNNGYPTFDPVTMWEWPIVYEIELDLTICGTSGVSVGVVSSHNSPSKDKVEDVPIPETPVPEPIVVDLEYFKADVSEDHVELLWKTVWERNTMGFNILRSTQKYDGYEQVYPEFIMSKVNGPFGGGSMEGAEYAYEDVPPKLGPYYYLLEEQEASGAKNHYGSVYVEFGDPSQWDLDGDGYPAAEDCNDQDPAINPGAREIRDGIDNNCDGLIDRRFPRRKWKWPIWSFPFNFPFN